MSDVFVTGGTGRLGRLLLPRLARAGHRVRALVRRPGASLPAGVDALTGDLADPASLSGDAFAGVDVIVHLASGAAENAIDGVDVGGTRLLIDRARTAGAPHLIYLSIVGVDRVPLPLYRAKVEIERLVATSGLPWTVLRATQFHELIRDWLQMAPGRYFPAGMLYQPIAADEVAEAVIDLVARGPANGIVEIGGPQVLESRELARIFEEVTGTAAPELPPLPEDRPADGLLAPGHHEGRLTWRAFLAERSRASRP